LEFNESDDCMNCSEKLIVRLVAIVAIATVALVFVLKPVVPVMPPTQWAATYCDDCAANPVGTFCAFCDG